MLAKMTVLANSKMSIVLRVSSSASERENRIRQHYQLDSKHNEYERILANNREQTHLLEAALEAL